MQTYRAAIAAAFLAFHGSRRAAAAARPARARRQGFPPTPVKIVDARTTPLEDTTEYVATLKSLRSTTIKPQIDGQITQIFVKSGDRVGQGARLMQIDPQRQQAAVSSQEAERAAREADVAYARQQQQRASELFAAGAVSKQELEQSQTALRTAEASLAGAAGAGPAAAGAAALLHASPRPPPASSATCRRASGCRCRRRRC